MSAERPFEITHLPVRLRTDFTGKLAEAASGSTTERENNFLSRALAAFAVCKLANASLDDAAAAVVDGRGDGGIDAAYYSPNAHTLWLIQSKYLESGRGEPDLGDVSKFCDGVENLLNGRVEAFARNAAWGQRLPQLVAHMGDAALRVRAVLVYSGINIVSDDRLRLFENLQRRFHPDTDYLVFSPYNLTSVHDWLTDEVAEAGVSELHLEILTPGWITTPFETIYGQIRLSDLAQIQATHGNNLVAGNIRRYKGTTEVNERIIASLHAQPQRFFYLNNGITAYCERLEVNNLDRADTARKRVRAFGVSIVNGAQTLGAIRSAFAATPPPADAGYAFIKIVSLERCEDDTEFSREITRSTNFQNQIGVRDFAALDDQQERIADQLRLSGITYHYKDADDTPPPDALNFTLDESTTALACLDQDATCDYVSRVLADRKSLWSMELVYPPAELYQTRYHRVFRPDRSARTVWRAVQARRIVVEQMQAGGRATVGVQKAFYEAARWLVLNIVFLRLRPERNEDLSISQAERDAIIVGTSTVCDALWHSLGTMGYVTRRAVGGTESFDSARHLKSVFCAAADCARLRNATLAELATVAPNPHGGTGA